MPQIGGFQVLRPEETLFATPHDKMRRTELFKLACSKGFMRASQPTPPKQTLIRILEDGIVVTDADELLPPDQPVPLNEAHKERAPAPVLKEAPVPADPTGIDAEEDDIFGLSEPASAALPMSNAEVFSVFQVPMTVFSLRKLYHETFPDEEKFDKKSKKVDILAAARRNLGLPGIG